MTEISSKLLEKARKEFGELVSRCGLCSQVLHGDCTPEKCYPTLVALLYPKGGCNFKSMRMVKKK